VIVFEDLHWIDTASDRLLTLLVETVAAVRVLLVLSIAPTISRRGWRDPA
jgi:predicted ATPase